MFLKIYLLFIHLQYLMLVNNLHFVCHPFMQKISYWPSVKEN